VAGLTFLVLGRGKKGEKQNFRSAKKTWGENEPAIKEGGTRKKGESNLCNGEKVRGKKKKVTPQPPVRRRKKKGEKTQ